MERGAVPWVGQVRASAIREVFETLTCALAATSTTQPSCGARGERMAVVGQAGQPQPRARSPAGLSQWSCKLFGSTSGKVDLVACVAHGVGEFQACPYCAVFVERAISEHLAKVVLNGA